MWLHVGKVHDIIVTYKYTKDRDDNINEKGLCFGQESRILS